MPALTDFVSAEESVLVRWEGTLRDRGDARDVVVGTTDRSLVFCSETGRVGVFPREHVSSVECRTTTLVEYDFEDYRLFVGGGAALSVATFVGGILTSSGLLALLLLLGTGAGLWLVEHGWRNREAYDGVERFETEVEAVVVHTDAGERLEFLFPADAGAGTELGQFVRSERPGVRAVPRPSGPREPSKTD